MPPADFSVSVERWVNQRRSHSQEIRIAIAVELVNRVKELTPVDTGFLRSNWTAIKAGDAMPIAGAVPDPQTALAGLTPRDRIMIVNPTIYARRIEYGFVGEDSAGRHFHQQGRHMMTQALAELPAIADRVLARYQQPER
jgi:hypothetical protein